MALMAVADGLPAHKCIAIAPPLVLYDWQPNASRIAAASVERHYIVGSNDQFCPLDFLQSFTEALSAEDSENVMVLPVADHFLFGREDMVAELAIEFLEK
jgi:alpha/beta superfamily hydrolase